MAENTNGKVVIVTGAGHGIGAAIARTLGPQAGRLACADADHESALAVAASMSEAAAIQCDVGSEVEVERLVALARSRFGRIDAIVSNAGVGKFAPLPATSLEDWNRVLATNLTASFLLAKTA